MTEQAESAPILWACDIAKSFGGVHALRGADFTLRRGEIHALIGENGAGKSTLVKIFTGIQAPDHGQVLLDGRTVRLHSPADAARHGIGAVFQELSQLNDLTVAQNIFAGREPRGRFGLLSPARMRMATRTLMDQFGIAGIDPDDLSGDLTLAQRQLVEVLKALSRRPRILILDEATSALPQAEVAHLFTIVRGLRDEGLSVIYISHRLEEIITLADRATVFRDGQHVAVVDPRETGQDQLINLMIGHRLAEMYPPRVVEPLSAVALEGRRLGRGGALHDVDPRSGVVKSWASADWPARVRPTSCSPCAGRGRRRRARSYSTDVRCISAIPATPFATVSPTSRKTVKGKESSSRSPCAKTSYYRR